MVVTLKITSSQLTDMYNKNIHKVCAVLQQCALTEFEAECDLER